MELLKHNEIAYSKVIDLFETENKVAIVHPTGTGKMYITLNWLLDNKDKKCLFLCSLKSIIYQLKYTMQENGYTLEDFPNLKLALYCNLLNWNIGKLQEKYDCIVLDEFHRAGAPEWGKTIKLLLESNQDSKVLGLSATPIRYVDKKDMVKEIFEGSVASEITLAEAISNEILPFPHYVSCVYSLEEDIKSWERKLENCKDLKKKEYLEQLLEKAKEHLENMEGIEEILKNHIKNENGKYLVFCKDISHLNEMRNIVISWFKHINPNVEHYEIHSDWDNKHNATTLIKFQQEKNDKLKLLFSVDMLNEGLHIKDIDGVVMLRPTDSHIVYLQQLGRALSVRKDNPIIIDIVNNAVAYKNFYNVRDEIVQYYGYDKYDENLPLEIYEKFKIFGYSKDIIALLEQIDFMYKPQLSFDEMIELISCYLKENSLTYADIKNTDEYQDVKIGNWKFNQRALYKNGKLSDERIKKLRSIGETFDIKILSQRRTDQEKIEIIKKYLKETNKSYAEIKVMDTYETYPIGSWKKKWRDAYQTGKINEETKFRLQLLGEDFNIQSRKTPISDNDKIKIITDYLNKTKKSYLDIYYEEKYGEYFVGKWKYRWRTLYRTGELCLETELLLKELGENFVIEKRAEQKSLEEKIEIIKEYLNSTGNDYSSINSRLIYKGYPIGKWKSRWRIDYNKNELDKNIETLLRNIGETFEIKQVAKKMHDKEKLEIVVEFLKISNTLYSDVVISTVYQEYPIGKWKNKWRKDYNSGKLNKQTELLLKELGEDFSPKINMDKRKSLV